MIRHDEHFLQLIHKHIGEIAFREIQQIPFFYFDLPDKFLINKKTADLEYLKTLVPEDLAYPDILPFKHFSFILANDPCLHIFTFSDDIELEEKILIQDFFLPKNYENTDDIMFRSRKNFLPSLGREAHQKKINKGIWVHNHCREMMGKDSTSHYSCLVEQFYSRKKILEIDLNELSYSDAKSHAAHIMEQNNNDMRSLLFTILGVFVLAEEKNKHLIKVRFEQKTKSNKNQNKKQSPSRYAAKHHYVYLDGPPAHVMSEEQREATGRTVRGHARRAHWHRLKHERFKNHPNFGQRIRIKASWVGPKEWADAGKIYTLYKPEDL